MQMGIPSIAAYPMPGGEDLPPGMVKWLPEANRAAFLIHDMQRYFVAPFAPGQSPVRPLVDNIRAIRALARQVGIPVFYTAQPGNMTPAERGLLHDFWGPGMSDRPADNEIIDELRPDAGDTVLAKWKYSAFIRSDLEQQLVRRGRDQLIVSGVYAHVGCLMTACDAFSRDIETFFVADAVADFTAEYHQLSLRYAAERCAVPITTELLLSTLRAS
jgi:bifunctional isochorismate lyase/aryl carrier protein